MANIESWEGGLLDLVKEEELTGDDDDGEFFSANHLLEIGAGTEDEDSISVKMDSCLLCAHTPAVTYDLDGNVIKRETRERELEVEYSDKQLFLNLCYLLGIRKKTRKLVRNWNFVNDPFPFCEQCEMLMASVTELYVKLEKLKGVTKEGIRKAEGIYLEKDLYGKHDWRYYEFRKLALGEPLRQAERRKVVQQTTQNKGRCLRPRRALQPVSPVTFVKSGLFMDDDDKDIILPDEKLEVPSPTKESRKKNRAGIKKLKRRAVKQPPKKLVNGRPKKSKIKKTPNLKETEGRKKNFLKRINVPPEDSDSMSVTLENASVKIENPPQENAPKNKGGRPRKHPVKIFTEEDKEKRREELHLKEKQAYEKRYSLLTKLVTVPRSEMSPTERSIFAQYPPARDPVTGEVTIFAGFGNRFMNKRSTLKFTKLEPEEGEECSKIYKYQCQSCSEIIIVKTMRSILQLQEFRAHFRRVHMGIHKCKLCPHLPSFNTASELLTHLRSAHGVLSRDPMRSIFFHKTQRAGTSKNHSKCISYNQKCFICGMPFESRNTIKYRLHLKSHMSEEEKKNFITTRRRVSSDGFNNFTEQPMIAQPYPVSNGSLCETCGIFVPGGSPGMKRHLKTNHEHVDLAQNERLLCSLCGDSFAELNTLTAHTKLRHPNGNPEGPILCRHPTCNKKSFESESNLEEHVSRVHSNSEGNGKGLMCLKCGRVLGSSWAFKVHGNVHSGEKNFKCLRCPKSFPLKATLTNHLATVHGEGEAVGIFQCEVEGCDQVFPCRVYLGQHLRKEHRIYRRKQKKEEGKAS